MSSNLPPGVTEGMIPGNTPEDCEYEATWEKIETLLDESELSSLEKLRAVVSGIAAIKAERGLVSDTIADRIAEDRRYYREKEE